VNLTAYARITQALLGDLEAANPGAAVVGISSIDGLLGNADHPGVLLIEGGGARAHPLDGGRPRPPWHPSQRGVSRLHRDAHAGDGPRGAGRPGALRGDVGLKRIGQPRTSRPSCASCSRTDAAFVTARPSWSTAASPPSTEAARAAPSVRGGDRERIPAAEVAVEHKLGVVPVDLPLGKR